MPATAGALGRRNYSSCAAGAERRGAADGTVLEVRGGFLRAGSGVCPWQSPGAGAQSSPSSTSRQPQARRRGRVTRMNVSHPAAPADDDRRADRNVRSTAMGQGEPAQSRAPSTSRRISSGGARFCGFELKLDRGWLRRACPVRGAPRARHLQRRARALKPVTTTWTAADSSSSLPSSSLSALGPLPASAAAPRKVVNDVSRLNPVTVAEERRPRSTDEVQAALRAWTGRGLGSAAGASAMGGQIAGARFAAPGHARDEQARAPRRAAPRHPGARRGCAGGTCRTRSTRTTSR